MTPYEVRINRKCTRCQAGKVGLKWTVHTLMTIESAQKILEAAPSMRMWRIAQELSVTVTTEHIVKQDLHLYPYKLQMLQALTLFSQSRWITRVYTDVWHLHQTYGSVMRLASGCWATVKGHQFENLLGRLYTYCKICENIHEL